MGKIPSLLLKMGKCQKKIAVECSDSQRQIYATLMSSYHVFLAIYVSLAGGKECSQSDQWVRETVKEAKEIAAGFYNECLPRMDDKQRRLQEAIRFSLTTGYVFIQGHPFQDVTILINKEVAFLAFELVSESLKGKDFQAGRQHLQTMRTSIDNINDSHALREKEDEETTKELKALTEDYRISCDIAQALEGVEAGNLIYSLAKKDLESQDVEYALNKGWDALDKFKEVERLSQSTMDDVSLEAKAGQGFIYFDVFKMTEKAKRIFISVTEQSAYQDFDWYRGAEQRLKAMTATDPGSVILYDCTNEVSSLSSPFRCPEGKDHGGTTARAGKDQSSCERGWHR